MNDFESSRRGAVGSALAAGAALAWPARVAAQQDPRIGSVDVVHVPDPLELATVANPPTTPTGVVVARDGRVFVFMPRFDDKTVFVVGQVESGGRVTPYPDAATNTPDPKRPRDTLFHAPNGVIDSQDRLWILDAGLLGEPGQPVPGAPKLVAIDLADNRVVATIPLGSACEPTSSLNDLRVESGRGRGECAFITDQGQDGQGAIVAVDLASGRCVRRLARHPSTASVKGVLKIVEGQAVMKRGANGKTGEVQGGANGIALSSDAKRLWYAPLIGRHLYEVSTAALLDPRASDADVAATIQDLGDKGITGGLIADDRDRVYLSLQELNAIGRRDPDGSITILAQDPRLIWPDTFWITADKWLYISATQVNRRAQFNGGVDRLKPPYAILRMRIDAGPA